MRVTSRSPGPDSARWSAGAPWRRPAVSTARTCGTCETTATARSCASASIVSGTAPTSSAISTTSRNGSGAASGADVTAHGRPSKSRGVCGHRAGPFAAGHRVTADIALAARQGRDLVPAGSALTLATSVTVGLGPSGEGVRNARSHLIRWHGDHDDGGRLDGIGRAGPTRHGQLDVGLEDVVRCTSTPASVSASARDVPINPQPMTSTGPSVSSCLHAIEERPELFARQVPHRSCARARAGRAVRTLCG